MILHLLVGILALGDPCLEKGLSEQQCKVLGLRVDVPCYWLNRFTKAQTFPMTVVLVVTIVLGLITVLLPNTKEMPYKDRFDQVCRIRHLVGLSPGALIISKFLILTSLSIFSFHLYL